MSNSPQQPAISRVWRLILLAIFIPILLAWLLWMGLDATAKRGLTRYERELEARGEHFMFADFVPKPVPAALNFAFAPVVASSYERDLDTNGRALYPKDDHVVNRLDMAIYSTVSSLRKPDSGNWAAGEKIDLNAFQLYYRAVPANANPFPVPAQPESPAVDVLLALSKYDKTIKELRQAAALPDSRFPLNYDCEPPPGILLPHLAALKKCCQVLQLRAIAELYTGQSDKALADVKLALRLMASVRSEPFLISQLVRIDMLDLALQPVWEGSQEHLWTETQLKELDGDLARLDFLADYAATVRSDRALEISNIEYMRRTREVGAFLTEGEIPLASEIQLRFAPDSDYCNNELAFARACQDWMLPIVSVERHQVSLDAVKVASSNIDQMRQHWSLKNVLAAMLLPALETCAERYSHGQSSVDMARVACALERYRLALGKYPESLNALAPRFIDSVPSDIIGGQPLKYHRTDTRFVLYSVGWNGTDDGGTVYSQANSKTPVDYDVGDWVWSGR